VLLIHLYFNEKLKGLTWTSTKVVESGVKYPTLTFPKFPPPTFPKFPPLTPQHLSCRAVEANIQQFTGVIAQE